MIYKTNNECLKGDKYRILTVLDHKHKVLGIVFFNGKVEYFGVNGMSLLSPMKVW